MKISNDRTYGKSIRIGLSVFSLVLVYDLIKATFEGSLRESSWTLKILAGLKAQLISMIHFVSQPVAQFLASCGTLICSCAWSALTLSLDEGTLYVALEIMTKWCCWRIAGSSSFGMIVQAGLRQQMVPSFELRYVYMKMALSSFSALTTSVRVRAKSQFNVSRLNSNNEENDGQPDMHVLEPVRKTRSKSPALRDQTKHLSFGRKWARHPDRVSPVCIRTISDYASYVILEYRALLDAQAGSALVAFHDDLHDGRHRWPIDGHTMKFHPHGDASIGDALV